MREVRKFGYLLSIVFLAVIATAAPVTAASVSPIQLEMKSAGPASRTQVTITNTSDGPLPLEANINRIELGENGEQKLSNGNDSFLVFPPQAMVPPGGTQVFRVQWVGEPQLQASQSFMMSLTQVPVKLPKGQAAVQVVMSFGVLINVAPPQGLSQLNLVGTGIAVEGPGKHHPTITVENPTAVHALLQQATIKLKGGAWSQTLTPSEIGRNIGTGLVQPGKTRTFTLPVDLPAGVTDVQASIDYRPK